MKKDSYWDRTSSSPMQEVSDNQNEKIQPISIEELDRGFIVRVGCQSIAFTNKEDMLKNLTEYINNPKETREKYYENKLFK